MDTNRKNKTFERSIHGYNKKQVDSYIEELRNEYLVVLKEKDEMEKKVREFQKQDEMVKKALIRVEETTNTIKKNTVQTAIKIKKQAMSKAKEIIVSAEREALILKQQAKVEAEKYIEAQKNESIQLRKKSQHEVETLLSAVQHKVSEFQTGKANEIDPHLKYPFEKTKPIKEIDIDPYCLRMEADLVVGKVVTRDIVDDNGRIVVPRASKVTSKMVKELLFKELYGELITAVDTA
ncbi:DivIVA domain-containing protein [Bacillus alkalicellulosilyticus]|uniref:DivIVA domain-containing protein n=1 Tax=Alkalihalobacterium alkalicellulosilyticum TaxID=1912214 RepID=UPI001116C70D|nr:DivIVA domain-containing protein [Bacillus alkalicellulosilyticus]